MGVEPLGSLFINRLPNWRDDRGLVKSSRETKPLSDWCNLRVKRNLSNDWLPPQSCTSVFSMVIGTSVFSKVVTSHATCTSTCTRSIEQDSEHAALRFMQEHASRFTILKQQRLTIVLRTCTCMTNRTRLLGLRDKRVNMKRYKSNISFSLVNMGEYSLVIQNLGFASVCILVNIRPYSLGFR